MNNRKEFIYGVCLLSVLVPAAGRLAYGIILVLLLNWLMLTGTLVKVAIKKLSLKEYGSLTLLACITALIVFFRVILTAFSPVIALTLSFSLYIAGLSFFILGNIFNPDDQKILRSSSLFSLLGLNMKKTAVFSLVVLFFYLLRDILGYGTISFPVPSGLAVIRLFDIGLSGGAPFWGTAAGAFVMTGVFTALYTLVSRKADIVSRIRHDTVSG